MLYREQVATNKLRRWVRVAAQAEQPEAGRAYARLKEYLAEREDQDETRELVDTQSLPKREPT